MSPDGLVLVTGATGFTGGHLARTLRQRGRRVRALVRPNSNFQRLADAGVEICEGQLVDAADVRRAMAGVQTVYHIAAAYRGAQHPDSHYFEVNVTGTKNVLYSAQAEDVARMVHCSTIGVHGEIKSIPGDELSPLNPGDVYQRSKLRGEQLVQRAIKRGVPATVFRPTAIYGPGDTRFLKLFRAIYRGYFRVFGSGQVLYHLTYIDDLVRGILLCGERTEAQGQTLILAGPRYSTVNELVHLVARAVERPAPGGHLPLWPLLTAARAFELACRPFGIHPPLHCRRCDFFIKNRAFRTDKAKALLGYEPRINLEEGLRHTAKWYFDSGLLERPGPENMRTSVGREMNQHPLE